MKFNDQFIGFCTVGKCRDDDLPETTGELWGIYVKDDEMNRGVGTALINKAIEHLKSLNYTTAVLWVLTSNSKSRQWYENRGWTLEGKTKVDSRITQDLHQTRYLIKLK